MIPPLAYWTGQTAGPPVDHIGGAHTVFAGNPTWGNSDRYPAIVFDGTGDYASSSAGTINELGVTSHTFVWIGHLSTGWAAFDAFISMRNTGANPVANMMLQSSGGTPVLGYTWDNGGTDWGWTGGPAITLDEYSLFAKGYGGDIAAGNHWAVVINSSGLAMGSANTAIGAKTFSEPYLAEDKGLSRSPPAAMVAAGIWREGLGINDLWAMYMDPYSPLRRRRVIVKAPSAGGTTHTKAASSTIGFSDTLNRTTSYFRSINDTVGFSESIDRLAILSRAITDTLGYSESVNRVVSYLRQVNDTIGYSDDMDRLCIYLRSLQDTVGWSDLVDTLQIISGVATITVEDTLGWSDEFDRAAIVLRALADTIGASDEIDRTLIVLRALSDTIGYSDAVDRAVIVARAISDTIGYSDSVSRAATMLRAVADTLGWSDTGAASGATVVAASSYTYLVGIDGVRLDVRGIESNRLDLTSIESNRPDIRGS